jgi:flagellar assembly protein FliH
MITLHDNHLSEKRKGRMQTPDRIQALRYPAMEPRGLHTLGAPADVSSLLPTDERQDLFVQAAAQARQRIVELEAKVASFEREIPVAMERGRLAGEEDGRRRQADEFAQALANSRASIAAAIEAFGSERRDYFRRVEGETVRLALAIARKVLHREAQMDPMLLRGAVRAALDRLDETSKVTLRVAMREGAEWGKILAGTPEPNRPSLVEDSRLLPGECWIESHMGTVELSIHAQLDEIERGFFDLLDQRSPEPRNDEPQNDSDRALSERNEGTGIE